MDDEELGIHEDEYGVWMDVPPTPGDWLLHERKEFRSTWGVPLLAVAAMISSLLVVILMKPTAQEKLRIDVQYEGMTTEQMIADCDWAGGELIQDPRTQPAIWVCEDIDK